MEEITTGKKSLKPVERSKNKKKKKNYCKSDDKKKNSKRINIKMLKWILKS